MLRILVCLKLLLLHSKCCVAFIRFVVNIWILKLLYAMIEIIFRVAKTSFVQFT